MVQAKDNPRYEYLMSIVNIMPDSPGVYRYLDAEGTIIYVGKAKNLKRRVSSYFTKEHESRRTANLVRQVYDLKYIVVNTENDALNLENRMIKQHQPKYNVLLKDGKTYPWICVRNEAFPRVFITRTLVKDGSSYFGPYTNVSVAHALVELFQQLYKVRTCSLNLQEAMIDRGYRTCLKYHIDKCLGPCERKVTRETYAENVEEIKQILRGHTSELFETMTRHMMQLAEEMRFEEASQVKNRMDLIKSYRTNSNIVPSTVTDIDVFAYDEQGDSAIVSYFFIVQGAIVQSYTIEYKRRLDEPKEDLLSLGILEMWERFEHKVKEIVVPFMPSLVPDDCEAFVPQRGDKRKLLELAEKNCRQFRIDQLKKADKLNPEQKQTRLLTEIKNQLGLPRLPLRIESFDNSNISGSDAVASCVVFINGKPEKKEYRKFAINSVVGPDDYASMREVVMRRYRRVVDEMLPIPDLILADGGIGQMGVIREALLDLEGQYLQRQMSGEISSERMCEIHKLLDIPVGGLVKDGHHRTRQMLFGNPPDAVDVKVGSELFHLLERIQEEVHRFAIKFHREKRSKSQVHSELDDIKGIGPKTKQELLRAFKSIKRLREARYAEVVSAVGEAKARIVAEYFNVPRETM